MPIPCISVFRRYLVRDYSHFLSYLSSTVHSVVLHKLQNGFHTADTTKCVILYFLTIEPCYNDIGLCDTRL
jgi:hypothetical protein